MEQDILRKLYEPFEVHTKPGAGGFKYIRSADVIDRMNKVFGGKWSTEIIKDEILEDTIVVRVLVSIFPDDVEYRKAYRHEGFGSSAIKRYSGGPNKDKIINLGSDYKAAVSMAIRNACSRWGAGLNLENDGFDGLDIVEESSKTEATTPIPAPSPMPPTPNRTPVPEPPKPTPTFPPGNPPPPPSNQAPPVEEKVEPKEEPVVEKEINMPKIPPFPSVSKPAVTETVKEQIEPPKSNGTPFPKIPMPTPSQAVTATADDNDKISDVQKAALNGLLTIRGLEYNKLAADAFTAKGMDVASIPQPDDLSYKQAVVVIKYGNDLFKKKN